MYMAKFIATHAVFTTQELFAHLSKVQAQDTIPSTIYNVLSYHENRGHIVQIRRGLYYSIPPSVASQDFPVDPYITASKLTPDATLAFHSALALHQIAYSAGNIIYYVTQEITRPRLHFQNFLYQPVYPSVTLRKANKVDVGTMFINREGIKIKVTTLERTIVDALDRPLLSGSLEELWQSLESLPYINVDAIIEYTLLVKTSITAARVGFFLSSLQERLQIPTQKLEILKALRPKITQYFQRNPAGKQKMIPDWNLIVPNFMLTQQFEEENGNF